MGMFEDLSGKVTGLGRELDSIHNRIDELNESSVSAHKRISELEQKLRDEITSIRNQLQSWSDARDEREMSILNKLQALSERVSKIDWSLVPSCVTATVTYCDPEGVNKRQNEESRKRNASTIINVILHKSPGVFLFYNRECSMSPLLTISDDRIKKWNPECGEEFVCGDVTMHIVEVIDATKKGEAESSPVPGTWAWACEQMLAGKTVSRIGKSTGIKWHMKIDGSSVYCRATDDCMWQRGMVDKADLTATDWQVVS